MLAALNDRPILLTILSSAVVMATSGVLGQTHSRLDVLLIIFSAMSFLIACDQFWRAFTTWHAMKKKLEAIESNA